ncbi:hypothetical protein ABZY68_23025 [Streptomyces sp. NPDC006482]|uniref:hypothetical protein n=1 Tax=Streptomyces sp. NPDC006482 TaxID=3154306 RepID=UPI00339EF667
MDDAFTLLRQAVDLLPEDAVAENGQTVGDVREDIRRQEWEMVLGLLEEFGDVHPVSVGFRIVCRQAGTFRVSVRMRFSCAVCGEGAVSARCDALRIRFRWGERSLAWLSNALRTVRDYEARPERSEAMVTLAAVTLMNRRLTRQPVHPTRIGISAGGSRSAV